MLFSPFGAVALQCPADVSEKQSPSSGLCCVISSRVKVIVHGCLAQRLGTNGALLSVPSPFRDAVFQQT